ncbi:MAG: response regulator [Candidatus Rokubacteria bacterium]|nr:response regulator [Candidatus Rokubacteria bacterium]
MIPADEQRARRLSILGAVTRSIASSRTPEAALASIARAGTDLLGAAVTRVWLDDPDARVLRAGATHTARDIAAADERVTLGYGEGIGGRVFMSGEPAYVRDVQKEADWIASQLVRTAGLHGCAALPLASDGHVMGVLILLFDEPVEFPGEEREVLGLLADHAAIALRNAAVFAEDRRARAEAEAAERQYRMLFDGVPIGLFRATPFGVLTDVNTALIEMLGYDDRDALLAASPSSFCMNAMDRDQFVGRLAQEKIVRGFEAPLRRCDGSIIWARVSARVLCDDEGQALWYDGAVEDITELRRIETRFYQAQRIETVGRLAGGIAHDFTNLLTIIRGRSQLVLYRLPAADPNCRDIALIDTSAQRAAALARKLLAFSRQQLLDPRFLNLNTVLQALLRLLLRLIGEDIKITTELAEEIWTVKVDPAQFEQVIVNLAVNARDAMPDGGTIRIGTANVILDEEFVRNHPGSAAGEYVRVAFEDSGHGMPDEVLNHLFEPFFTTKEPGKGTGLGLSTTYGIVKQHGGYIGVTSQLGAGSAFVIYFPRVEAVPDALAGREPGETRSPHGRETILVVEDEDDVRAIEREMLEAYGYTVLEAGHPEVALRIARDRRQPIDLVVSDIVMPGMNGLVLGRKLQELRPAITLMFVSGYSDSRLMREASDRGDVRLLEKPFTPETLARAVRETLEQAVHARTETGEQ